MQLRRDEFYRPVNNGIPLKRHTVARRGALICGVALLVAGAMFNVQAGSELTFCAIPAAAHVARFLWIGAGAAFGFWAGRV